MARFNLSDYDQIIEAKSKQYGLPASLIRSVIQQESRGNPNAKSPVGAQGLMQLMPETAKDLGVKNPFNPAENIDGGVRYLKQQINKFGLEGGLAAYNAGAGNVQKYGGIPPFKETQNYVSNILNNFNKSTALGSLNNQVSRETNKLNQIDSLNTSPNTLSDLINSPINSLRGALNLNGQKLKEETPESKLSKLMKEMEGDRGFASKDQTKRFNDSGNSTNPYQQGNDSILSEYRASNPNFNKRMDEWLKPNDPNVTFKDIPIVPDFVAKPITQTLLAPTPIGLFAPDSIKEGFSNSIANTISGFTTPQNLGIGAALSTPAAPAILAAMTPSMIQGTYDSGKEAYNQFSQGNISGGTENLTNALINGLMTVGGAKSIYKAAKPVAVNYYNSIPNSAPQYFGSGLGGLQQIFDKGKEPPPTPPKISDIPPFEMGKKERGFVETVRESPRSPAEVASGVQGRYNPQSNNVTLAMAQERIALDPIKAREEILSTKTPSAVDVATGFELMKKYNAEKDFTRSIEIANHLAKKGTDGGQFIQAYAMYDRLGPEGLQKLAAKTVQDARAESPVKQKQLTEKTVSVVKELDQVNSQVAEQLRAELNSVLQAANGNPLKINTIPAQLAERLRVSVENRLNPKTNKFDPIKEIVNSLSEVAKAELPPSKSKPPEPIELVRKLLKNEESNLAWEKSKAILNEKFKNNPQALAILDGYFKRPLEFKNEINNPVVIKRLDQAVNKELKDSKINLGEIVKEHYTSIDRAEASVRDALVKKAGLEPELAAQLDGYIIQRFNDLAKAKKEQILKSTFKERVKSDPKSIDQKIIEYSNLGAFKSEAYRELIAEKMGVPHLSNEMGQKIMAAAQDIQTLPEGSRQRALATAELLRDIGGLVPPSILRKIAGAQVIAQLYNPKTIIRNFGGNAIFNIAENVKDFVAAPLDRAVSMVTGKRTRLMPGWDQLREQGKGFVQGLKEGKQEALKNVDLTQIADRWEINNARNGLPQGPVFRGKILGTIEKTLGVALKAPDRAFYKAAFNKSIAEQMKIKGVDKPTPEMIAEANIDGLYSTFQGESRSAKFFTGLKRLLNGGKEFGAGNILVNYAKTPGNLLSTSLDYSPVGFTRSLMELGKASIPQVKNRWGGFDQKKFVNATSRAIVGSGGFTLLGYVLSDLGIIKNSASRDQDLKAVERSIGIDQSQLNATGLVRWISSGFDPKAAKFREGDTLATYDWAVPLSVPLSMGASAQEKNKDLSLKKGALDFVTNMSSGLEGGLENLGNQPLIKTFTNLGKGKTLPRALIDAGIGIPSSFTPTITKQIGQLIDNTSRDLKDRNPLKMAANLVLNKTPFNKSLPARIDSFGKQSEIYQDGGNSIFNVLFNPSFTSKYKTKDASKLIMDLYDRTSDASIMPLVMKDKFKFNGISFELNAKEKNAMQKWVGTRTETFLTNLSKNEEFKKLPDSEQVSVISKSLLNLNRAARAKYFQDYINQKAPSQRKSFAEKFYRDNGLTEKQIENINNDLSYYIENFK